MSDKPARTEQNTVCFTGHRILSASEKTLLHERLRDTIRYCYQKGYRWFMCGGALGFDMLAALEVINAKEEYPDIGLSLAIPCEDQATRWGKSDRDQYVEIIKEADEIHVLSEKYYNGCMHIRNQFMVHHASLCVCYLRCFSGGTGYTVRYAVMCRRNIINLCLPELNDQIRSMEPSWNFTFIFPSVSANALTVHSIHLPAAAGQKWKNMSLRFCGKRHAVRYC